MDNKQSDIIIYTTDDGLTKIETTFGGDTVWLSKAQMAELFQRDRSVISKHIKNIFEEGELLKEGNVQILHIANSDKPVEFYNLDVIISVGQLVSGYLDFAESQAEREQTMTMQDWAKHLDRILTMSGEQLLIGNGSGSHKQAVDKATA